MPYDSYNAYLLVAASTPSEYWRDGLQEFVNVEFNNASDIFTIQKLNTSTNLYENITVRLTTPYDIKQNATNEDDFRQIIFKNDDYPPLVGDSYYFNSYYWICVDTDSTDSPTTSCIVQKCDRSITLYKNGILSQVPIIILDKSNTNDTQVKSNLNRYVFSIDADFVGVVSSNARNLLIAPNDVFKIGDLWNYRVTKPDDISKSGLIILPFKFYEADQESHVYAVTIQNDNATLQVDDTFTLDAVCTVDGQTIALPTLSYSSSNTSICTVSSSGVVTAIDEGTATITVSFNGTTDSISVTVQETVVDDFSVVVSGGSNIILNNNLTLTASIFNNGVIDESKSVTWTFSNQDGSSNVYCTLVSSTCSSITLKSTSNSAYVGKYVVVRGSKSDDATIYGEKIIMVKSLF